MVNELMVVGTKRPAGHLQEALDARLAGFEFEEGAILVQIPQVPLDLLEGEVARNRGYFAYPPQGLLYLSAVFGALGVEARIVDLNFVVLEQGQKSAEPRDVERAWRDALDTALEAYTRPFVCVSFMFDPTYPQFRAVCEEVRRRRPTACIAAGGVNATADAARLVEEGLVDFVFTNEGEYSLERFYRYVRGQRDELPVNLVFRDADGAVVRTEEFRDAAVDFDIREQYDRIAIAEYHRVGSISNFSRMNGIEVPFATVLAKRGCRAQCTFCGVRNFNGKGVRVREVDGVVEEMEHLHRKFGIQHFDWLDDDLVFDRQSSLRMFRQIAERLPGVTWAANNGIIAAAITPDIMDAMQASGCIGFKVGLESGNPEVLRKVKKPTSLDKFYEFAVLAQGYPKMFVAVNFIIGLPEERFGQMLDSFTAATRARLDWNNFYLYQHIKNTALYIAYGGLSDTTETIEHGREGEGPNMNPVRGGGFRNYRSSDDVRSGYDVIELDPETVPSRRQLREIWFTFNTVANFLRMPAVTTDSEIRLRNGIRWMEVLSQAYPEDAAMACVLYFLRRRLAETAASELERRLASDYWKARDRSFAVSAFLDGVVPPVDPRLARVFTEPQG